MAKNVQKEQARSLYMAGRTQKEIAKAVQVTEKTVGDWAHGGSWKERRGAIAGSRDKIAMNLLRQIDDEAQKESPNADTIAKLASSLVKLSDRPSLPEVTNTFQALNEFIAMQDQPFAQKLVEFESSFINEYYSS